MGRSGHHIPARNRNELQIVRTDLLLRALDGFAEPVRDRDSPVARLRAIIVELAAHPLRGGQYGAYTIIGERFGITRAHVGVLVHNARRGKLPIHERIAS